MKKKKVITPEVKDELENKAEEIKEAADESPIVGEAEAAEKKIEEAVGEKAEEAAKIAEDPAKEAEELLEAAAEAEAEEVLEAPAKEKKPSEVLDIIRTALILLLVTGLTVILLALVNYVTSGPIAERKKAELDSTVGTMFPGMQYAEIKDFEFDAPVKNVYAIIDGESEINGFCVITVPQGFGGDVEMLVGVDTELSVVGVKITEDSETASKSKPVKEKLSQYENKKGPFEFGKDGVDAVSSSTVTSTAVLNGVNSAADAAGDYLDYLRSQEKEAE